MYNYNNVMAHLIERLLDRSVFSAQVIASDVGSELWSKTYLLI
jgi:hypothetical protein